MKTGAWCKIFRIGSLLIVLISLHVRKKYGVGGSGGKGGEYQRGEAIFSSSRVWFLMSLCGMFLLDVVRNLSLGQTDTKARQSGTSLASLRF